MRQREPAGAEIEFGDGAPGSVLDELENSRYT